MKKLKWLHRRHILNRRWSVFLWFSTFVCVLSARIPNFTHKAMQASVTLLVMFQRRSNIILKSSTLRSASCLILSYQPLSRVWMLWQLLGLCKFYKNLFILNLLGIRIWILWLCNIFVRRWIYWNRLFICASGQVIIADILKFFVVFLTQVAFKLFILD